MIGDNQTSNKMKAKIILSPISRETELFLVEAKCEGVCLEEDEDKHGTKKVT